MIDFKIPKLSKFVSDFRDIPEDASKGAKQGMETAMETWEKLSKEISMFDKGNLNRAIQWDDIKGTELDLSGTIRTDVFNGHYRDGSPFNYAAYWHNLGDRGIVPKTKSGVTNHLSKTADDHGKLLVQKVGQAIFRELRRKGW